jgi:aryl-alcohol dehydrogenase-like predicted oxidoreductase
MAEKKWALDEYQLLGRSGLRVSPLCLGTMTFGDSEFGTEFEQCKKMFDAYFEKGGNFFDTANVYGGGESERFLGQLISSVRSRSVVATKYTFTNSWREKNVSPLMGGNSRKSLAENIDESLKRLGTGYIDLLYVHAWEYRTPVSEVMRALDDVVRSGKALYTGISDTPSWVIAKSNSLAEFRGWSPYIALQTRYNLLDRSFENDLGPMTRDYGIGVIPWGAIAEGFLSGKYKKGEEVKSGRSYYVSHHVKKDQNWEILKVVQEIAAETKKTASQVAINWLLNKGATSPLVGARTVAQLEENLDALSFSLTADQVKRLDTVSNPSELPFPQNVDGWFNSAIDAGKKIAYPSIF